MAPLVFTLAALIALMVGSYIYLNPELVIVLQKKFYALINWRMEPISIPKEIRNTKLMGAFLIVFTLMCAIYYWLNY